MMLVSFPTNVLTQPDLCFQLSCSNVAVILQDSFKKNRPRVISSIIDTIHLLVDSDSWFKPFFFFFFQLNEEKTKMLFSLYR